MLSHHVTPVPYFRRNFGVGLASESLLVLCAGSHSFDSSQTFDLQSSYVADVSTNESETDDLVSCLQQLYPEGRCLHVLWKVPHNSLQVSPSTFSMPLQALSI